MLSCLFLAASMLMISDRDDFWEADDIAPQTQFAEVDGAGVTLLLNARQIEQAWEGMEDKKILILVHGFDTPDPYAYYDDVQTNIRNLGSCCQYDQIIGYVWPCSSWDYYAAKDNIEVVAPRFRNILTTLQSSAARVDVFAHSLGNRLVLEAADSTAAAPGLISNFFSIAPAVDDDSIDDNEPFFQSVENCGNMYVFYSQRDPTLKWLYPIVEWNEALGYEGDGYPYELPPNVQMVDCSAVIDSHSAYLFSKPVYDFFQELETNQIPGPYYVEDVAITGDGTFHIERWRHEERIYKR